MREAGATGATDHDPPIPLVIGVGAAPWSDRCGCPSTAWCISTSRCGSNGPLRTSRLLSVIRYVGTIPMARDSVVDFGRIRGAAPLAARLSSYSASKPHGGRPHHVARDGCVCTHLRSGLLGKSHMRTDAPLALCGILLQQRPRQTKGRLGVTTALDTWLSRSTGTGSCVPLRSAAARLREGSSTRREPARFQQPPVGDIVAPCPASFHSCLG